MQNGLSLTPFYTKIFAIAATLRVLACTLSEVGACAKQHVKVVNVVFLNQYGNQGFCRID